MVSLDVAPFRVFISYTHESEQHRARVLRLANQLRVDGIDAWIDRFSAPPPEGWSRWMERQFEAARWIVLVCTEAYWRRFNHQEEEGKGRGVTWEGRLVRGELYGNADGEHRFIPVIFSLEDSKYIPSALRDFAYYNLEAEYAEFRRHLLCAPEIMPQPLGK
jgi:hypothetical protein